MLAITVKFNEVVRVGDALIFVEWRGGSQCQMRIDAPKEIRVDRTGLIVPKEKPYDGNYNRQRAAIDILKTQGNKQDLSK